MYSSWQGCHTATGTHMSHGMLPATQQRWHSHPYHSQSWYSIKRPLRLKNSPKQKHRNTSEATCSCLVSRSTTVSSSVLVGLSEHRTTRWTLRSACSRRPLASAPTRTTLRSGWLSDMFSVFFVLHTVSSHMAASSPMLHQQRDGDWQR